MTQQHTPSAHSSSIVAQLAEPPRIASIGPIAARFLYSLRLIALHERARRDPVPELAVRLGSVETAAKSLTLAHTIGSVWPENIQVSRFCCQLLTHDEASIGAMIDAAGAQDRTAFEGSIEGLIRPDRLHRLWDAVLALIAAEHRAT
ncbi:DNA-directed RNA polymerase subunit beta' [uncultured Erythrobacter sp.]|uniref:DNA-directed RNA polymerase subunit beta' n=1 Tax=uncultured Erythrobacter sp. TaxID=263913 RepID=UPI0026294BCD|nr:DNA-directed RNA polymerase subunit beta' [uncultured Erythrobacter sp.]